MIIKMRGRNWPRFQSHHELEEVKMRGHLLRRPRRILRGFVNFRPAQAAMLPWEPDRVEIASCRDVDVLAGLAKLMQSLGITADDTDEVVVQKFGGHAFQASVNEILVRVGDCLFFGRPEDFKAAQAYYYLNVL